MADEKTVDIIIRGKNLSPEAFAQAQKQLKDLGYEVETSARKTKAAAADTGVFAQSWKQLTAGFTAANLITDAVYGLIGLGKAAIESASHLVDLKDKTGLSLDFLQRMGHVAKLSGSDVDQYADVIYKMGLNVAKGGEETRQAVAKMGMSWADFKRLSPEEQFLAMARNIDFTSDVQERNATLTAIAGKSVSNVLVGLVADYQRLADGAAVASDEQIESIDAAADAWDEFMSSLGVGVTRGLGNLVIANKEAVGSSKGFIDTILGMIPGNFTAATSTLKLSTEIENKSTKVRQDINLTAESSGATRDWGKELKAAEANVQKLTSAEIAKIETAKKAGATQQELTDEFSLSAVELRLLEERTKSHEQAEKSATDETKKRREALERIRVAGIAVTDTQRDQILALKDGQIAEADIARALGVTAEQIKKVIDQEKERAEKHAVLAKAMADADKSAAKELTDRLAREAAAYAQLSAIRDKNVSSALAAAVAAGDKHLEMIQTKTEAAITAANRERDQSLKAIEPLKTLMPAVYEQARQSILAVHQKMVDDTKVSAQRQVSAFSEALKSLPSVIADALSGGGDIGAVVSNHFGTALFAPGSKLNNVISGGMYSIANAIGGPFAAEAATSLAKAIPGLGAVVGPVLSSVMNKIFGSAGRDAVKDFAESMGGFDSLRTKLIPLGDEGERLWKNLTQGVGKNNPAQAKAAIEAITRALEEQAGVIASEADILASTKLSWKEAEDLVKQYGIEVENSGKALEQSKLNEQSESLAANWRKLMLAGLDVADVTTGMADEAQAFLDQAFKMGLEVPESMRPMLQKMADMGLLTDASGNKMKDLSGIQFSTDPISRLVMKMDELLSRLFGLGDTAEDSQRRAKKAFDELGNNATDVGSRIHKVFDDMAFEVPVRWNVEELPNGAAAGGWTGGGSAGMEPFASGGMAYGPLLARIEPGRKEMIGDVSFMTTALTGALERLGRGGSGGSDLSGAGGAPTTIVMPIYLGTEKIDERIIKVGQSALQGQVWQVPATAISGRSRF